MIDMDERRDTIMAQAKLWLDASIVANPGIMELSPEDMSEGLREALQNLEVQVRENLGKFCRRNGVDVVNNPAYQAFFETAVRFICNMTAREELTERTGNTQKYYNWLLHTINTIVLDEQYKGIGGAIDMLLQNSRPDEFDVIAERSTPTFPITEEEIDELERRIHENARINDKIAGVIPNELYEKWARYSTRDALNLMLEGKSNAILRRHLCAIRGQVNE